MLTLVDTVADSMTGYTKLFGSIVLSTIWREPSHIRIVWITMLALADKRGIVEGSVPGLADMCRVTVDECREALEKLAGPDPDSRTKDHEGRRITAIGGGWLLINHSKYRAKLNQDERREYLRVKQQECRAKKSQQGVNNRRELSTASTQPEAAPAPEADALAERESGAPGRYAERPSRQEVQAYASMIGLAPWKADDWFDEMEGCGWRDHNNRDVVAWQSVLTRVRTKWELDGRPTGPPARKQARAIEGGVSPAELIVRQKELDAIGAKIQSIRSGYDSHHGYTSADKVQLDKLYHRQRELRKILGWKI
jgi:hypothetical protein